MAAPAAGQSDPLIDLLNRRGYDRDAILRQFPSEQIPADAESGDSPDNATDNPAAAPGFLPLQARPAAGNADKIALVLPTLAGGLAGQAARNVHLGCQHGIRASGRVAEIKLYPSDGDQIETARNYAAAVAQGAQAVIGPMLKKNVKYLLAQYSHTPIPTLLLQPGGGEGYFVMTLDSAQEADDLARLLFLRGGETLIVEQAGERAARQSAAFEKRWLALGGRVPARFRVLDNSRDWQRLFDMLKEEEEEEAAVIFSAGDPSFATQVRNFTPQRHLVFAVSTANTGSDPASILLLENLGFMEMPWFVGLNENQVSLDSVPARALSAVRQRFFVLGADACRAALNAPAWQSGWLFQGLAGDWRLQQDQIFARQGQLAVYRSGRLHPLP